MVETLIALAIAYIVFGAVLNRLYLWLRPPPESVFPGEGAVFRSESEGFTQRVVRADGARVWVELTMDPHAPGPPPHVHARFAERLYVASGCVTVELRVGAKSVCTGEEFLIAPGMQHRLRNVSENSVVVRPLADPSYALPRLFGLFLVQAYGFFDESPANARPPRALLQLSFWSPLFDVWLPGLPIVVQQVMFALIRPLALVLGYRPWYPRFVP